MFVRAVRVQIELLKLLANKPIDPNVESKDCHEDQIARNPSQSKPVPERPNGQITECALSNVDTTLHQTE